MSLQENSELKASIDTMMSGLNGMLGFLDKNVKSMKNTMTKDQAEAFAKQMKDSNLDETLEKYKNASKDLKRELNID